MEDEWIACQQIVIGFLFHKGTEQHLHRATSRLLQRHFSENYKKLWAVFVRYNKESLGVLNTQMLRKYLRSKKVKEEDIFQLEETLQECEEKIEEIDEGGFNWHVGRLIEVYKECMFSIITEKGYELLSEKGFTVAKEHLLTSFSELESASLDHAPDGFLSDETESFVQEVKSAKDSRDVSAVDFGFPSLDAELLGARPGDAILIAGWTGVGKTTALLNVAVHVAFNQGKNTVFVTTETVRAQLRRRLFSRITKMGYFDTPIRSKALKSGYLTDGEKESLVKLKSFFKETNHGAIRIVQAPANATMNWLRGKLLQCESMFRVDLLILDDIRNMTPSPRRRQEYEEIAQLARDFKRIARTHAGRGIPVVSPWHVSREAYKEAKTKDGRYDLAALASTSEAERLMDGVVSLWQNEGVSGEIKMDVVKMRDGKAGQRFTLQTDFDYQYVYEMEDTMGEFEAEEA